MTGNIKSLLLFILIVTSTTCFSLEAQPPAWVNQLNKTVRKLEPLFEGEYGVYVYDLESDKSFSYQGDQFWYLSSTVKVPVAIALLQMVDQKKVKLTDKITIKESDYRDGAGPVNWIKPGEKVSYKYLLDQMLIYSDNAATDLIIKKVGLDQVNELVASAGIKDQFGPITTLLDVRVKAYSEFHPGAEKLTNLDYMEIKKKRPAPKRIDHLAELLKVKKSELKYQDISEGFDQYYAKRWNSATLVSYAEMMKKLLKNELLTPDSTSQLLKIMAGIQTGKKRIRRGLPRDIVFAHKTGTQHRQACDIGVAMPKSAGDKKVLILVCTRKWKSLSQAAKLMAKVGELVSKTNLLKVTPTRETSSKKKKSSAKKKKGS